MNTGEKEIRQLREAVSAWRKKKEEGDWIGVTQERDTANQALSSLLEMMVEEDCDLLLLDGDAASSLELLARTSLKNGGTSSGYERLRRTIMDHPEWVFLPGEEESQR